MQIPVSSRNCANHAACFASCGTVGVDVTYLANIWAGDEPTIAAAEAKNYIFPSASTFWDQDAPGRKLVRGLPRRWSES